jgi:hypothetical protein
MVPVAQLGWRKLLVAGFKGWALGRAQHSDLVLGETKTVRTQNHLVRCRRQR